MIFSKHIRFLSGMLASLCTETPQIRRPLAEIYRTQNSRVVHRTPDSTSPALRSHAPREALEGEEPAQKAH